MATKQTSNASTGSAPSTNTFKRVRVLAPVTVSFGRDRVNVVIDKTAASIKALQARLDNEAPGVMIPDAVVIRTEQGVKNLASNSGINTIKGLKALTVLSGRGSGVLTAELQFDLNKVGEWWKGPDRTTGQYGHDEFGQLKDDAHDWLQVRANKFVFPVHIMERLEERAIDAAFEDEPENILIQRQPTYRNTPTGFAGGQGFRQPYEQGFDNTNGGVPREFVSDPAVNDDGGADNGADNGAGDNAGAPNVNARNPKNRNAQPAETNQP